MRSFGLMDLNHIDHSASNRTGVSSRTLFRMQYGHSCKGMVYYLSSPRAYVGNRMKKHYLRPGGRDSNRR